MVAESEEPGADDVGIMEPRPLLHVDTGMEPLHVDMGMQLGPDSPELLENTNRVAESVGVADAEGRVGVVWELEEGVV